MKLSRIAVQLIAAMTVSASMPQAGAQEHHQHAAHEAQAVSPLPAAKKWATDEVVRSGMDNIRKAVMENRAAIQKGRLGADEYRKLAQDIDRNVADIVKNCKLAEDADAAFHSVVLADLMHGGDLMRGATRPAVQRAGAFAVIQSLRSYGKYFEHPGWTMTPASSR